MGPTGSGKSTLLDALAGRKQGRLGAASRILVDGKAPGKNFHRLAGYCEQHESLLGVYWAHWCWFVCVFVGTRSLVHLSTSDRRRTPRPIYYLTIHFQSHQPKNKQQGR